MITAIISLANGQRFVRNFQTLMEARLEISGLTFPVSWSVNVGGVEVWAAGPNQYPSKKQ